jgi:hypothetical protein
VGSADPALLEQVVANKWLGRKTGKGMFVYPPAGTKGKKEVNPEMVAFIEKMRNGAPAQVHRCFLCFFFFFSMSAAHEMDCWCTGRVARRHPDAHGVALCKRGRPLPPGWHHR